MTFRDILAILSFAAFRPEPDDPTAGWRRRFPNHRTALLSIGRSTLAWRGIQKNGRPADGDLLRGDPKELLSQVALSVKDAADDGWCAVSLNTRYVISLETNLSRRPGSEEVIKSNPRSVLGARYERGKRYAVTHSPETNSSILVACDEEHIRKTEAMFKEAGLQVGRICCGAYLLLRHALALTNTTKGGDKPTSFLYVVCCQGSVCAMVQDQDRWMELRSRTDVYEQTVDPALELLAPFKLRIPAAAEVVLVCDDPMPELTEGLERIFSGHKVTDHSQQDLLWTLIAQN
ncbi:MAG: hypothetical protein ACOYMS_01075 [Terrimicrobiaceae bacterium]